MFNYKMVFIFLLINASQVNATVLTGSTTGIFSGDQALLEWGNPQNPFTGSKSSLKYNGVGFSINNNQPFKIGTLTYSNTRITSSSSYNSTFTNKSFDIGLGFTAPASANYTFNYDLQVVETDNSLATSSDTVALAPANNFNPVFTLLGQNFSFELLGFSNDSINFNNSFNQAEGSSSPVDLYAKISAVPVPSAILLFITALTVFFITGNRKRS